MFSSNQIFEISGCLSDRDALKNSLEFALKYYGIDVKGADGRIKVVYQVTQDEKMCIGWGFDEIPTGWKEFPDEFDIDKVIDSIEQFLSTFPLKKGNADGSYKEGFVMRVIKEYMGSEYDGIKNPFYGIVYFEPYTCFYSR